jgi:signal transduction histidine kinase/ActR/RegA family two-component response regulator
MILGAFQEHPERFPFATAIAMFWSPALLLLLHKVESSIKDRLKLEHTNNNTFITKMTHEIRTPLVGVFGVWQLLREQFQNTADPTFFNEASEVMESCLQNVRRLTDDVMDVSRLQHGQVQLEYTVEDFQPIVGTVLKIFQPKIETINANSAGRINKKISLVHDSKCPDISFVTDRVRLTQILINLVGNAVKFTNNGEINISTSLCDSNAEVCPHKDPQERHLTISVSDTGPGLNAEDEQTLFRPFEQGSAAEGQEGTGIGLTISKELTKLLGGTISGRSRKQSEGGTGSVFQVVFPIKLVSPEDAKNQSSEREVPIERIKQGGRVLVVDDNDASLFVFNKTLSVRGLECDFAKNGIEAMQKLREDQQLERSNRYCLVMLDLEMPQMTGQEVLEQVADEHIEATIVVTTAHILDEVAKSKIMTVAKDILVKPIGLESLLQVVANWSRQIPDTERCIDRTKN